MDQETGEYDCLELYLAKKNRRHCNFADCTGPVEVVDIPGRGKGLVVTSDVDKGSLLLAAKAFVINFDQDSPESFCDGIEEKLRRDPWMARDFYALYAGDLARNVVVGEIDYERIYWIGFYNLFQVDEHGHGLWLPISYINHSCLRNAEFTKYSDMAFIYALYDLKKGDEVTISYSPPFASYKFRQLAFRNKWNFSCHCDLCLLDRDDPCTGQRDNLLDQASEIGRNRTDEDPEKSLNRAKDLLADMRRTYTHDCREQQNRCYLIPILRNLQTIYRRLSRFEELVKVTEEIFEVAGDRFKYDLGPNDYYAFVQFHEWKGDRDAATKFADKAYEWYRTKTGRSKEVFMLEYSQFDGLL